jgi:hypothetical protein
MSQLIAGLDLERLVEKMHRRVGVAMGPRISPLTRRNSADWGLAAIASLITRSAASRFDPFRNRASWMPGSTALGSNRIASRRNASAFSS